MKYLKPLIVCLFLFFISDIAKSQIGLMPLGTNVGITSYLKSHPDYVWNQSNSMHKWGIKDTLEIPFFEDFTSSGFYPDSAKWRDNNVFVNTDFAISPPSYGVATFDFLNAQGHPYSPLEIIGVVGGDTLTSQAINLKDSMGKRLYTIKDSFFFSFMYQTRGYGDIITKDDSLRLEFLDNNGRWSMVWSKGGDQIVPFRQVIFPILQDRYLHQGFQFRFINITHLWGNNNHWHVDYIYLNNRRGKNDIHTDDYAIQSRPTSLLKNYFSMPYDHFMADVSEAADSVFFYVSNRNSSITNAEVRYEERHNSNLLISTKYSDNAGNVPASGSALRKVDSYNFSGLSGFPVVINRTYSIRESGRTNPVLFQKNDEIKVDQIFERYYAYDDGTAESGFGFNDLKSGDGQVVVAFNLKKADTLRAVGMYLTHNINDLSKQRFVLQIWEDIQFNGGMDKLIYEHEYITDSLRTNTVVNGYVILDLKEVKFLQTGKFYVGWAQDRNYNLGVGFDKNNGYLRGGRTMNKNIYFNIGDGWLQNQNAALVGAPMIRPIFGVETPWSASVEDITMFTEKVYPNPAKTWLQLPKNTLTFRVYDLRGVQQSVQSSYNILNIAHLNNGIYFVHFNDENNHNHVVRFIKAD